MPIKYLNCQEAACTTNTTNSKITKLEIYCVCDSSNHCNHFNINAFPNIKCLMVYGPIKLHGLVECQKLTHARLYNTGVTYIESPSLQVLEIIEKVNVNDATIDLMTPKLTQLGVMRNNCNTVTINLLTTSTAKVVVVPDASMAELICIGSAA